MEDFPSGSVVKNLPSKWQARPVDLGKRKKGLQIPTLPAELLCETFGNKRSKYVQGAGGPEPVVPGKLWGQEKHPGGVAVWGISQLLC